MRFVFLICLLALVSELSNACSEPPPKDTDLDEAFTRSKYVLLVSAEQITHIKKHRYNDSFDMIEDVKFRIIYSFKGDKHISDTIFSHTDLGFGCTLSVLNDPIWIEQFLPIPIPLESHNKINPLKISGTWLIFIDSDPFILSGGSNRPIELASATDWIKLFRLAGLNARQQKI